MGQSRESLGVAERGSQLRGTLLFAAFGLGLFSAPLHAKQPALQVGQAVSLSRRARIIPQPAKGKKTLFAKGTVVVIKAFKGKRALVQMPSGRRGWFPKKILIPVAASDDTVGSSDDAQGAMAPPPPSPPPPPPKKAALQDPEQPVLQTVTATAVTTDAQPQSDKPKSFRVAVYALQVHDVPERVGRVVSASLTAELRKLQGLEVIGVDEIVALLNHEANKQLLGCEQDSCAAEIAGALGVDEIVVGNLSQVGTDSVISLRRLDPKQAKAVRAFDLRMNPAQGEEFLAVIGDAVETLYPQRALLPGQTRGPDERLIAALNPPPLPAWLFYGTAGLTALCAVGAVLTTVGAVMAYGSYNDLAQQSTEQPVFAEDLDQLGQSAQAWDIGRWSTLGAFAGLGLILGFEAILTDWQGAGEQFD